MPDQFTSPAIPCPLPLSIPAEKTLVLAPPVIQLQAAYDYHAAQQALAQGFKRRSIKKIPALGSNGGNSVAVCMSPHTSKVPKTPSHSSRFLLSAYALAYCPLGETP